MFADDSNQTLPYPIPKFPDASEGFFVIKLRTVLSAVVALKTYPRRNPHPKIRRLSSPFSSWRERVPLHLSISKASSLFLLSLRIDDSKILQSTSASDSYVFYSDLKIPYFDPTFLVSFFFFLTPLPFLWRIFVSCFCALFFFFFLASFVA